nr:unnamed protein product [Callosobruchus analis]CAI5851917.1 unnamed protein product [Callosobruchus analis]
MMEVNRLLSDELTYELEVRNLPIGSTVNEKRMLLRDVFRKERLKLAEPPNKCSKLAEFELPICEGKLEDLRQSIASFDHDNRENEFRRIYTRLTHVSGRLSRLACSSEQASQKHSLYHSATQLICELNRVYLESSEFDVATSGDNVPRDCHTDNEGSLLETSLIDAPIELLPEVLSHPNQNRSGDQVSGTLYSRFENLGISSCRDSQARTRSDPLPRLATDQSSAPIQAPSSSPGDHVAPTSLPGASVKQSNVPVVSATNPPVAHTSARGNSFENPVGLQDLKGQQTAEQSYFPYLPYRESMYQGHGCRSSHVEIGKWNVRFDGRGSVTEFLERIEELRVSRGVTKERLLQSAVELFTHEALLWFRTTHFTSWDDLCVQLRHTFQPYDYEYELWDEIRRRTQGSQERVVTYAIVMENLFRKLSSPVSESTKVNMIRRNLLPYIHTQLALHQVTSVSQLTALARAIEEAHLRAQKYQPPPTNARGLMEPELRYKKHDTRDFQVNALNVGVPNDPKPNTQAHGSRFDSTGVKEPMPPISSSERSFERGFEATASNLATCWNCGGTDHKFRKCRQPRRELFCFKCGRHNVSSSTCPRCSSKNCQLPGQETSCPRGE